ncbi:pseudouridine synthase [Rubritalea marina]|uniref:pseudouridine synthase n=1 Tax=Rubritalea marina TaxID=361055 RepID=UPI00036254A5|nr:pseudouridine synthase [Rubritalea marina]
MHEEPTQIAIRLNKYLASCGIGSRRKCDELIKKGNVVVNGKVCTDLATSVTEDDFVKIGNTRVLPRDTSTIMLNKPKGLVCTKSDELERETIYELLPPNMRHLNHVGRLDRDSEGLLIMTNDGNLAQELSHPGKKVEKEYLVTVNQAFSNDVLDQFLNGIWTGEAKAYAKAVKRLSPRRFLIVLETGLKRQIRLMCKAAHLNVVKLVRIRVGHLTLGGLDAGRFSELQYDDLELMMRNPKLDRSYKTKHSIQKTRGSAAKKKTAKSRPKSTQRSQKSYKRKR